MHTRHTGPSRLLHLLMAAMLSLLLIDLATAEQPDEPVAVQAQPSMTPLVVLLTDFGERGYLVGALKGAIYSAAPEVRIDAISHSIERFDVQQAGWVLALAAGSFPPGTIFVAIVSPDKSGPRQPIVLRSRAGHLFVAPDNGLLTQVALRYGTEGVWSLNPGALPSADGDVAFSARDLFAPAAGALARGVTPDKLGSPQDALYVLSAPPASLEADKVVGTVTFIDRFGNVFTNIQGEQLRALGLEPGATVSVKVGDAHIDARWVTSYADVKLLEPLAQLNSWAEVKLALNQGDLAKQLEAREGACVQISPGRKR